MATTTQVNTDTGIDLKSGTSLRMMNGASLLDDAVCVLTSVLTDATGNFTLDITSMLFTVPPFPVGHVYAAGASPITASTLLANSFKVNFFPPTTTQLRGFVERPNTIVLGGLGVALLSSPVTVNLILFGK